MKTHPAAVLFLVSAVSIAACGTAGGGGGGFEAPGGSGDPGAASQSSSGSSGFGSSSSGGTFRGDASTSGGPLTDAACATDVHKSKASALDLYIMQDQSGSMKDQGKWTSILQAFTTFVQSPQAAGIGVGIQYFPLTANANTVNACAASCTTCQCVMNCGCNGCTCNNNQCSCNAGGASSSCSAADYAAPDVEIAALPGAANAIISSLQAHQPNNGTPTHPALDGAIQHARAYAQAHSDHKVVVVLATDGEPNDCVSTVDNVAQLAAAGAAGSPPILTFVIGVGGDLAGLDPVAAAGGTQKAILVDTNANANQQFLDALNKIRQMSVSCEYSIPTPSSGSIDYTKVNVEYTPSNGQPVVLGQVPDASKCDPSAGGWYYDDAAHPTKIEVCPVSCTAFNNGTLGVAEVNVAFGCDTVKQPLK